MDYKIKLNTPEDVNEFVKAANECDFDVDISYNRFIVDAKSILGVLCLNLRQSLKVSAQSRDIQFEEFLKKYEVA
ncbi:HPr family phosphocarrier protein [Anaeromicropila herbilytica]|uniref:HPr domain-containing protein n=1 Tax=Anaeromicropila herbilytica TaxID=2785025 RepID=A0A7R7IBR4_9FIRM|nr:HPr family phosphocarrier protein [Anaeromicropila herbilytica]BCN29913.1 hypothetical protein bsdtb5_12080 [Anaeromicropila herbilytica]